MIDFLLSALGALLLMLVAGMFGVVSALRTLSDEAPDLYAEWIRRRKAGRGEK